MRDLIPEPASGSREIKGENGVEKEKEDFEKRKKKWDKCQILEAAVQYLKEQGKTRDTSSSLNSFFFESYVEILEIVILKMDKNWKIAEVGYEENCQRMFGVKEGNELLNRSLFSIFDFKSALLLRSLALSKNAMFNSTLSTNSGTRCSFYCYKPPFGDHWLASVAVLRKDEFLPSTFENDQPIDLSSKVSSKLVKKLDEATNNKFIEERPILASLLLGKKLENGNNREKESQKFLRSNLENALTSADQSNPENLERKRSIASKSDENEKIGKKRKISGKQQIKADTKVIVETFPLSKEKILDPSNLHLGLLQSLNSSRSFQPYKNLPLSGISPPFPIVISSASATPIVSSPFEYLSPAYREIYLRLEQDRLELKRKVMEKERELQQLALLMKPVHPKIEPNQKNGLEGVIVSPIPVNIPATAGLGTAPFPMFPTPSPSAIDVLSPVSSSNNSNGQ
ncbi:hypothetical protein WR25_13408 [Diploscapter pachys]|uniref:Uncharacterized protein n=1 Tax=Diploscapter pachys TaxID=2018661 RepID=A0A2A2KMB4_9BILA|nr:hypothetical protein WR25_13408 [Diploscapter pachys]